MCRQTTKLCLLAALGLGAIALATPSAQAQFMPYRPGASYWFNQQTSPGFTGFGQNYGYNFGFRINHVNPVTGQRFSFGWSEGAFNAPPGFFNSSMFSPNFYGGGYMSGGYGATAGYNSAWQYGSGSSRGAYTPYPTTGRAGAVNGQWGYEMGEAKGNQKITLQVAQLLDPTQDELLSGTVHNELLTLIRKLESKGAKAESALLPGGLVDLIEFTGGPAASVLTLLKGGKPQFPEPLLDPDHLAIKMDLEAALQPLAEALLTGNAANPADANKMMSTVATAKKKLAETTRNLPLDSGLALTRFLNSLDGVARTAKEPKLNGAFVPGWKSVGPSLAEFSSHLEKYQLQVAPALEGQEEAYATLHRGLVSYYTALNQAQAK